jgi:hypothetical protein
VLSSREYSDVALPSSASLSVLQQLRAIASSQSQSRPTRLRGRRYLDEDDSEEEADDGDPRSAGAKWYPMSDTATEDGKRLRFGGEFGGVGKRKRAGGIGGGLIWDREKGGVWGGKGEYAKVRSRAYNVLSQAVHINLTRLSASSSLGLRTEHSRDDGRESDSSSLLWPVLFRLRVLLYGD